MKKLFFLFVVLLLASCSKNPLTPIDPPGEASDMDSVVLDLELCSTEGLFPEPPIVFGYDAWIHLLSFPSFTIDTGCAMVLDSTVRMVIRGHDLLKKWKAEADSTILYFEATVVYSIPADEWAEVIKIKITGSPERIRYEPKAYNKFTWVLSRDY